VVLDIDGSLHQIHSENKQEAAANYKGGYGFHPIYCFADATGRPSLCGCGPARRSNNIADHVALLDAAIAGLPPEIAVGHGSGDEPASYAGRSSSHRLRRLHRLVWHAGSRNAASP